MNTNTNTTSTGRKIWEGVKFGLKYTGYAALAIGGAYLGVKAYEKFGKTTFSDLPTPEVGELAEKVAEAFAAAGEKVIETTKEVVK